MPGAALFTFSDSCLKTKYKRIFSSRPRRCGQEGRGPRWALQGPPWGLRMALRAPLRPRPSGPHIRGRDLVGHFDPEPS